MGLGPILLKSYKIRGVGDVGPRKHLSHKSGITLRFASSETPTFITLPNHWMNLSRNGFAQQGVHLPVPLKVHKQSHINWAMEKNTWLLTVYGGLYCTTMIPIKQPKNNQYVMDQPPDAAQKRRACY